MEKVFCVVSHTHWDREWYMNLEKSRTKLVDLLDRLLVILEKNPEYIFHMDAQTVVLDDYLEVHPQKRELLKKHISEHRIIVGPWYLQNDFYLTSGESTIRNLLKGAEMTREFGASGRVGYAPDQFGNISQLPQILDNFGIDNFIFGRGYSIFKKNPDGSNYRENRPSEFIWKGADGTKALAVHMRFWYNNAQRFSADPEKAKKLVERCERIFDGIALTPYLLLTNGVDHLEPQGDLCEIIKEIDPMLGEGRHIVQYNMDDYIDDVKKYVKDNGVKLPEYSGELRNGGCEILAGTLSSRHYIKVANVRAQSKLENALEPLYTMLDMSGLPGIYPLDHMKYLWKNLIKNHPHDSICGCSCDAVHRHMENRYEEIMEFSDEMQLRGMTAAAVHSRIARENPDDFVLAFANTSGMTRSSVVPVTIYLPCEEGKHSLTITDENGKPVAFTVLEKLLNYRLDVFSPINLPGSIQVDRYTVCVYVTDVPPFSFKSLLVKKAAGEINTVTTDNSAQWENEFLKVSVDARGKVSLFDKLTGRSAENCLWLEDTGDFGDAYLYRKGNVNPQITTKRSAGTVRVTENNELRFACEVTYKLNIPATTDDRAGTRSENTEINYVVLTLSLSRSQRWLEVGYRLDNKSENHRLRLVVDTDVYAQKSLADIPFDIVRHGKEAYCFNTDTNTLPNSTFAAIESGERGFAVLTEGAHEYEQISGRSLAFTILRARGNICVDPGDRWLAPEDQCKRVMEGRIALMFYSGDAVSAGIPTLSVQFRTPLLSGFDSCDGKKFCGGRPAVQDTEINELFYMPDEYPSASIGSAPAFEIKGDNILVTAVKKSEDDCGHIIRIVNLSEKETEAAVSFKGEIYKTDMSEERRSFIGDNTVSMSVGAKKIITLFIK